MSYDDENPEEVAETVVAKDPPASANQPLPPGRVNGPEPPQSRSGFTQKHFRHAVAAARFVDSQFPVIESVAKFCNEDAIEAGVSAVSWQHWSWQWHAICGSNS